MPIARVGGVRVLCLTGSPGEMGLEHGRLLRETVAETVERYIHRSHRTFQVPYEYLIGAVRDCLPQIPGPFLEEMEGIAEGAGVPFEDIVAYNCIADIDSCYMQRILRCCNFVLGPPATADGLFLHGRNLDFPPLNDLMAEAAVAVARADEVPNLFVSFAGMAAGFTGTNAAGIAFGEVSAPSHDACLDGVPLAVLMRHVLGRATDLDDAVRLLKATPRTCGFNLALSDGKARRACGVEMTHGLCATREARGGVLVVDNVCFCRRTGTHRLTYPEGAFRYARVMQLVHDHYGAIDEGRALSFLRDRHDMARPADDPAHGYNCICNEHTVHSVLFLPAEGRLFLSHGCIPAPEGPYREIRLDEVWAALHPALSGAT